MEQLKICLGCSMIIKIVGIALIGTLLCVIVKGVKPDFVVFCAVSTCIIILLTIVDQFALLISASKTYLSLLNIGGNNILETIIKVLGVGYIVEFASDIAEDSGFSSIASKLVFAGKVIVATMCLPYIFNLFELVLNLV